MTSGTQGPTGPATLPPTERTGIRAALSRVRDAVAPRAAAPAHDGEVTPLPPLGPDETLVELIPLSPPHAFARIVFHAPTNAHRYEVVEPPLTDEEAAALAFLKDTFVRTVDVDLDALDAAGAEAYLAAALERIVSRHGVRLSPLSTSRVGYYLRRDFLGFGRLDALMTDPGIEDVSCDGPGVPLFVHHRKLESIPTNVVFETDDALDSFVMSLVQRSGKHISVAEPLVDATLPDGSRLQASLSREVTTRGSTFTIRRFRDDPLTPPDLLRFGTLSPEMLAYLWLAVEHGASAIVCGGTASGKTTLLNALSLFIPRQKKIVTIEDTREINLTHENWIPGVTRSGAAATGHGKRVGEVDMFDLLKAALRQRPEYLILGEVRGSEAYVLFQAMATGHTVYSTMHADSVASAVHRLESKPIEIPRNLVAGLEIVVVLGETRVDGRRVRKVRDVVEIAGVDPRTEDLLTNRVFAWDNPAERFRSFGASHVERRIAERRRWDDRALAAELARRARVLALLGERGIRTIDAVSATIASYAIDPDATLAELEAPPRAG